MRGSPQVAVVVLCWNGIGDTLDCLRSLAAADWPSLDVLVVDNGSEDGTPAAVRASGLAATVVENGDNLGFAAGNNVGISLALSRGADAVLVLNNDTAVAPDAIGELVAALQAEPGAAACSPVLHFAAEPDRLWFAGAPFDPARGRSGRASPYELGTPLPKEPFAIDRVVGAAMLVRRAVIEQVGMFAGELFFLHEDVDWSLRVRAAGWQVLLVPRARVAHRVAASQVGDPVTPTTAYYGTRNDLEMGRRHAGGRWRRQALCVAVHLGQVRRARRGARIRTLLATVAGVKDYRGRHLGRRKLS